MKKRIAQTSFKLSRRVDSEGVFNNFGNIGGALFGDNKLKLGLINSLPKEITKEFYTWKWYDWKQYP